MPDAPRRRITALALLALAALAGACVTPPRTGAEPAQAFWDSLAPGTQLQVRSGGVRTSGRVLALTADSLTLLTPDTTVIARAEIDSLWRRPLDAGSGIVAGLIAGGLFAGALTLTEHQGGDDPGLQSRIGLTGGVLLGLLGLAVTAATPSWELLYVHLTPKP